MRIFTFDTTLRDGTQGEAVSFSADDKILVVHKLDDLGIDYIEGGWPGSNPKDKDFFARAKSITFRHARLTAFGATPSGTQLVVIGDGPDRSRLDGWSRPASFNISNLKSEIR